jgi:WD40 repeat protein
MWTSVGAPVRVVSSPSQGGEVAFCCENGELWLVSESDPEPRRMAQLPEAGFQVEWSNRRKELLAMGRSSIWGIASDGVLRVLVEAEEGRHFLQFAYSEAQDILLASMSRLDANHKSTGVARAYDLRTGEACWQTRAESLGRAPAIDPLDRWGFLATTWGEGHLFDLKSGESRALPGQSVGSTRSSSFSPAGTRLFASNGGRSLEVRALPRGNVEKRASISTWIRPLDMSLESDPEDFSERGAAGMGASEAWLDEGSMLIARPAGVSRWNADLEGSERFAAKDYCYDVRFSSDGRWLLFREFRGDWVLIDVVLRREVARLPKWSRHACFAADGTSLLIRSQGWCRVDLGSLELLERLDSSDESGSEESPSVSAILGHLEPGRATRVQPNQWVDASSGIIIHQGAQLRSRSLRSGLDEFTVDQGQERLNRGLAWHPGRGWLASANGRVRIYDDRKGELLADLGSRSEASYAVAFHPGSNRLATGGADGQIVLWETRRWTPVLNLRGHDLYVRALEFSPDGRILASASGDRSVRLWDSRPKALREEEADAVRAARSEVREAVESLVSAGTSDLAAAIHRLYPAGVRRAAALSWMHELASGGELPFVSGTAPKRSREAQRGSPSENDAGADDAEGLPPGSGH